MTPSSLPFALLLTNLAATWFMLGLVWFVQVVHYFLFDLVGASGFARYAAAHARRTTWVVGPPMLIELTTSVLLLFHPPFHVGKAPLFVGVALVGVIWLSTALLQVPRHNILGNGYNEKAHRALVTTNWIRTLAWTVRAILVLWLVVQVKA